MVGTSFGRAALRGGSRAATRRGRLVIADDPSLVRAVDAAFVSQKQAEATGPVPGYWQARPISWWKCSRPATLTRSCTRRRWHGFRQARAWSSSPSQRAGASLEPPADPAAARSNCAERAPSRCATARCAERLEELSEALATPICQPVLGVLASDASVSPRGSPLTAGLRRGLELRLQPLQRRDPRLERRVRGEQVGHRLLGLRREDVEGRELAGRGAQVPLRDLLHVAADLH